MYLKADDTPAFNGRLEQQREERQLAVGSKQKPVTNDK